MRHPRACRRHRRPHHRVLPAHRLGTALAAVEDQHHAWRGPRIGQHTDIEAAFPPVNVRTDRVIGAPGVAYSRAEAECAGELTDTGTGTQQSVEKAQSALDSDLASLTAREANLELVMSGATENDIAIAWAEVDRLTAELASGATSSNARRSWHRWTGAW